MESTTSLLLWLVATWAIASIILGISNTLKNENIKLEARLKQRLMDIVHCVRVEEHNKVYYWYDNDDNRFLAQGSTSEEIVEHLKSRFPDHIFFVSDHFISEKTGWKPHAAPEILFK